MPGVGLVLSLPLWQLTHTGVLSPSAHRQQDEASSVLASLLVTSWASGSSPEKGSFLRRGKGQLVLAVCLLFPGLPPRDRVPCRVTSEALCTLPPATGRG